MSATVTQRKNFVDGEWVDAVDGGTMAVLNPATAETIAEVPAATAADVDRAVLRARRCPSGSIRPRGERAAMLLALADAIDEHAEELAQLESLNVGKPIEVARAEPPAMSDCLRFFAGAARNLEGKASGEYLRGYTRPRRASSRARRSTTGSSRSSYRPSSR